jgi:hypothetical protein
LTAAGAILAGHPYPGQRYKHGWIPVAGFNPGAYHQRRHELGHVDIGARGAGGIDRIGSVHKAAGGGFEARHSYGGKVGRSHHATEGEARSAIIRGHMAHIGTEHKPSEPAKKPEAPRAPEPTSEPVGAPKDAKEAFGMGGAELQRHADAGSKVAQAEIDRRAAKRAAKGKPPVGERKPEPKAEPKSERKTPEPSKSPEAAKPSPVPSVPDQTEAQKKAAAQQAPDLTPEQRREQNRGGLNVGDTVSANVGGRNATGTVEGFDQYGRPQVHIPGHGTVTRSGDQFKKTTALDRETATDLSKATDEMLNGMHRSVQTRLSRGGLSDAERERLEKYRSALEAEQHRREVAARSGPTRPPGTPAARYQGEPSRLPSAEEMERADRATEEAAARENGTITPAGYTLTPRVFTHRRNGEPVVMHTQRHNASGERIGSVVPDTFGNGYRATYMGKRAGQRGALPGSGTFATRREAHEALAAHHNSVVEKEAKKTAAAQRRASKAEPVGHFQPYIPEDNGTLASKAAIKKLKQGFQLGDHKVLIETAMTKDQTKGFLDDLHAALLKTGLLDEGTKGVTFHVPSGDSHFRSYRRGGTVGAYVRRGERAVYINPRVADGEIAEHFGGPTSGGSFMPAAKGTTGRQYTITHELGHVLDNEHEHTFQTSHLGSRQVAFHEHSGAGKTLHQRHRQDLSGYGRSNTAEGYAEAYAQWVHGGPSSSAAADAYAREFGWPIPKAFQHTAAGKQFNRPGLGGESITNLANKAAG